MATTRKPLFFSSERWGGGGIEDPVSSFDAAPGGFREFVDLEGHVVDFEAESFEFDEDELAGDAVEEDVEGAHAVEEGEDAVGFAEDGGEGLEEGLHVGVGLGVGVEEDGVEGTEGRGPFGVGAVFLAKGVLPSFADDDGLVEPSRAAHAVEDLGMGFEDRMGPYGVAAVLDEAVDDARAVADVQDGKARPRFRGNPLVWKASAEDVGVGFHQRSFPLHHHRVPRGVHQVFGAVEVDVRLQIRRRRAEVPVEDAVQELRSNAGLHQGVDARLAPALVGVLPRALPGAVDGVPGRTPLQQHRHALHRTRTGRLHQRRPTAPLVLERRTDRRLAAVQQGTDPVRVPGPRQPKQLHTATNRHRHLPFR
eukprot:CAMPEP_0118908106 /NCGR_PEP_ID=MMETSP1166-20130328/11265_1 /TAXON_ID=1104430 /ORGANISM="Chrysoreinhardia sp, Strain CCMP3193" /LENGTH=364 /DNA_ID=CAMNT_0006847491 /DNA_START=201 /DNA_END=1292 /DNA_ORIENTATION=+